MHTTITVVNKCHHRRHHHNSDWPQTWLHISPANPSWQADRAQTDNSGAAPRTCAQVARSHGATSPSSTSSFPMGGWVPDLIPGREIVEVEPPLDDADDTAT